MPYTDYYEAGICTNAVDLLAKVQAFLLNAQWILIETQSGASEIRVFRSPQPIYTDQATIVIEAVGGTINLYGFPGASSAMTWAYGTALAAQPAIGVGMDLFGAGQTVLTISAMFNHYWIMADNYRFLLLVDTNQMAGYAGFIDTYYEPIDDPYPLLIKGMASSLLAWGTEGQGCMMYSPVTNVPANFSLYEPSWNVGALTLEAVQPGVRNGTPSNFAIKPNLGITLGANTEIRGTPRGVYRVPNGTFMSELVIEDETYIHFPYFAYGPKVVI